MNASRHTQRVRARFSAAATGYDDAAAVQQRVARTLMSLLPATLQPRRVADIGCGTGWLTDLAHKRWPDAHVDAVDISDAMIARARARLAGETNIAWTVADAARAVLPPCDLLLSSSTLHWLVPFDAGLRHVAGLVGPAGHFAAAVMLEGTLRELHEVRLRVAPATAPAARMPKVQDVTRALDACGLTPLHSVVDQHELSYPSAPDLVRTLRQLGVTGGELARGPRALTRRELTDLFAEYAHSHAAPGGGVRCTYVVGYFLARRP